MASHPLERRLAAVEAKLDIGNHHPLAMQMYNGKIHRPFYRRRASKRCSLLLISVGALALMLNFWGQLFSSKRRGLIVADDGMQPPNLLQFTKSPPEYNKVHRNTTFVDAESTTAAYSDGEKRSSGACLITMDDNHWIPEWLAYHYHTMNLRYLVIVVDPLSVTSPSRILQRWENHINIEQWTDVDIFRGMNQTTTDPGTPGSARYDHHKERQLIFYQKCLQNFQKRGLVDWVLPTDIDEYIGLVPRTSKAAGRNANYLVPSLYEPGSILTFLNDVHKTNKAKYARLPYHPGCVPVPRRQYGTVKSTRQQVQQFIPELFKGENFLTLRWRHWNNKKSMTIKVLVDVSRANLHNFQYGSGHGLSVHNPLPECLDAQEMPFDMSDLVVSHYLGTPDQFFFRTDSRRGSYASGMKNQDGYDNAAKSDGREDDSHRLWFPGFCKSVGLTEAKRLLLDAGQISPASLMTAEGQAIASKAWNADF
ncbi:expressed unknown protein [Seminavis robusta]|uniref:Glycosyltransferase family 92 protein n=1 Tax=Seminavis robusta TaxID=568900 RepID=A0A9N8HT01_9STRA|nr:expressed unknown protein [Seminavis robusta]|eukprot:Sro1800_g298440.1 n/a (479) ;mRNA; r:10072-11508